MTVDPESTNITNRSGGADLKAQGDINIGGDVVGRDKIESAGGHIIHAAPGSTVIIGEPSTSAPQNPSSDFSEPAFEESLQRYCHHVRDLYSTTRMLGKLEPVSLEGIFTDVFLLDRPTAARRFDIEALKLQHVERGSLRNDSKRVNALELASQQDRLFILGKPGAGKTTFLKYLTLRAATGDLDRVPVFISLNEWANSGLELLPFIHRQFEICAFSNAAAFVQQLLTGGAALVCFDGLDEVNEADEKRAAITRTIRDFANQYPANKFLITCRIAATDYTFEKFTYAEMADLMPDQVQVFARKWFERDETKAQRFVDDLKRDEHRGLRELAQTPLLLTLLCLSFEETLTFPARRAELYEEALDALLKKWDASRNIKRDEAYRGLSLGRKRQLLARVAAEFFERGEIFFHQSELAQLISAFLKNLPGSEAADESDGEVVLKAIEAQHGIFVERAHRVYSFSHLTLQEYFTARYFVDHAVDGVLERLIKQYLTDDHWREVFLLTASMLPEADGFFATFQRSLDDLLRGDERLLAYSRWAANKANDYAYLGHAAVARAAARATAALDLSLAHVLARNFIRDCDLHLVFEGGLTTFLELTRFLDSDSDGDSNGDPDLRLFEYVRLDRTLESDFARHFRLYLALDRDIVFIFVWCATQHGYNEAVFRVLPALALASQQAGQSELAQLLNSLHFQAERFSIALQTSAYILQKLLIRYRNIGHEWSFTDEQQQRLVQYEQGTVLLAECLKLAAVSDRKAIENRLLLPPEE